MIKITDEMVEAFKKAFADDLPTGTIYTKENIARHILTQVAPLIAKAEAEECALIAENYTVHFGCEEISKAIRARFKTVSEPKSEE